MIAVIPLSYDHGSAALEPVITLEYRVWLINLRTIASSSLSLLMVQCDSLNRLVI